MSVSAAEEGLTPSWMGFDARRAASAAGVPAWERVAARPNLMLKHYT